MLGRFLSPDSIVPDAFNPLDWDRYQYVRSNPLIYSDAGGHFPWLVLIGVAVFLASLPGDSGPYNVSSATTVIGDTGLRMVDPVDWVYTGAECLNGNCDLNDVILAILPFLNEGMKHVDDVEDLLPANPKKIVEVSGQSHHIFSNKIMDALDQHSTLRGIVS